MRFSFRAPLWKWPGDMGWYFVSVPKPLFETIRAQKGKGLIRSRITLGSSTWETSLLPHTLSGTYLIAIKASMRKKKGLCEGDEVEVRFCIDEK